MVIAPLAGARVSLSTASRVAIFLRTMLHGPLKLVLRHISPGCITMTHHYDINYWYWSQLPLPPALFVTVLILGTEP